MSRKYTFGFALLVATATTLPAYAQPSQLPTPQSMASDFPVCTKKASDADQEIAKQKFIAARQDYEEANYDSAIRRFKGTYELDCSKPELLLIISSAFEKKGDKPSALAALEVYTQRAPKDAPDMPTTLTKIENMKKQLAATPPPTKEPPPSAPPKEEVVQEHTIWPWITVGVGVAVVAAGVVVHLTAPNYPPDCNRDTLQCTRKLGEPEADYDGRRDKAGDVHGQHITGTALLIGGGVLVVGGLVWHFLEPTGPKTSSRRQLAPSVAPGFAGLSYGGTF